mgnify:CR=1 FL=1
MIELYYWFFTGHWPCSLWSSTASSSQLNMRGVFLHVLGDALGSVVVIISALIIWLCEGDWRFYVDPAMRYKPSSYCGNIWILYTRLILHLFFFFLLALQYSKLFRHTMGMKRDNGSKIDIRAIISVDWYKGNYFSRQRIQKVGTFWCVVMAQVSSMVHENFPMVIVSLCI